MELNDGDLVAGRHGEGIGSMKVVGTRVRVWSRRDELLSAITLVVEWWRGN